MRERRQQNGERPALVREGVLSPSFLRTMCPTPCGVIFRLNSSLYPR